MIQTGNAASLTIDEAAEFLGLHANSLGELARAGDVPGWKVGKEWRFLDLDLIEYARAQYAKNGERKCRSTSAVTVKRGGLTLSPVDAVLDDLLARPTEKKRSASTTKLKLHSGSKSDQATG